MATIDRAQWEALQVLMAEACDAMMVPRKRHENSPAGVAILADARQTVELYDTVTGIINDVRNGEKVEITVIPF